MLSWQKSGIGGVASSTATQLGSITTPECEELEKHGRPDYISRFNQASAATGAILVHLGLISRAKHTCGDAVMPELRPYIKIVACLTTWHCCRNRGIATALGILVRPFPSYMIGLWLCGVTAETGLGSGYNILCEGVCDPPVG